MIVFMSNMIDVTDLSSVFEVFKTNVRLAEILSVGPSTVSEMKRRNSIPVEYWPEIVAAAQAQGDNNLTLERMAIICAQAAKERSREAAE